MTAGREARFQTKTRLGAVVLAALVFGLTFSCRAVAQRAAAPEVLTNESIINMTGAKLNKDVLLVKIGTTRNSFDVTVNGIVNLSEGKVNADVIKSMISAAANPKLGMPTKTPEVLENQSIITMVTAKVPKAVVMAKIQNTKANYDVSANGLVSLTQAKVPSDVIQAMVSKSGGGDDD